VGAKDQGADATAGRWLTIPRTLCFITRGDEILLLRGGEHKRVYPGRYNGVGGHVERDEDPLTGALREIKEETGLSVANARFRGVIHVDAGNDNGILVFVFSAEAVSREVADSDEGTLEWVPRDRLNDLPLVEDLPLLIPLIFDSAPDAPPFFVHTSYDAADRLVMRFAPPYDAAGT
jgi:8-oxo-dGTP diphosphatase